MAHLSLYRKFRPEGFDKLVRQEHVVRVLKNQISAGTVGHAYLFCGPRGTGKTTVARIFARAINCEHPQGGSPCGKCPTCLALKEGSLDLVEIDAASNNGVAEMRELREKVQYPPVTGKYKVYIVDEVHMLTDSAFNALLKTLEEPPAHAVFILATTEPHKIPATILSRCMRLDFKLIPQEDLERHLKSILAEIGRDYEDEAVAAIARAGAGSDRDMLSIAEMCLAYSEKLTYEGVTAVLGSADFRRTGELVAALLKTDSGRALALTEEILGEGKSVGVLCRDVLEMLNRVAVAKTCANAEKLLSLPAEFFRTVKGIADGADGKTVLRAAEIFARAETDLRFVSSPRIRFETAVMRVAVPEADYDIDALLVRVGRLEEQLKSGVPARAAQPAAPVERLSEEPSAKAEEPAQDVFADDGYIPEEPAFSAADYEGGWEAASASASASAPAPAPVPAPVPAPAPAPAGEHESAEIVYGKFLRLFRKRSTNGVLFTMCRELEPCEEGGTLVLYAQSETIFRALGRDEHRKTVAQILAELGVTDFAIKLRVPQQADGLRQFKADFEDYPIETK